MFLEFELALSFIRVAALFFLFLWLLVDGREDSSFVVGSGVDFAFENNTKAYRDYIAVSSFASLLVEY